MVNMGNVVYSDWLLSLLVYYTHDLMIDENYTGRVGEHNAIDHYQQEITGDGWMWELVDVKLSWILTDVI